MVGVRNLSTIQEQYLAYPNLDVDGSTVVNEKLGSVNVAVFARLHQCRQSGSTEGIGVGPVT